MKHFYQQRLFKSIKTIVLLLIITFSSNAYAQLTLSGQQTVCEHESEIYTLQGTQAGIVYSWSITPSIGSINLIGNNQAIIQWNTEDTCIISVSGGGQTSNGLTVIVHKTNKPTITFTNQVGCQKISMEDTMSYNEIITDPNTCVNVCEYSEVEYTAHGTLFYGKNMSQYTWNVSGGKIIGVDGVTLNPPDTTAVSGSLFVPNGTYSRIAVKWDSIGTGTITVSELTPYGVNYPNPTNCGPKTTTMCVDIIGIPQADFLVDNQHFINSDDCYQICLNQTVNFLDASTLGGSSPIIFYKWDFGDGSPVSHQPSPQHTYTKAGNYDVSLTVTNQCNCTDEYSIVICVDDIPAPDIACPSVVCENDKAKYTLDANCNNYKWLISGGTKLSQNDPEIEIQWDKVDSTGFGYLSIDGSQCDNICPALSTIRIPVILQNGTIKGPKTVCPNKIYRYELPAWPATNFYWSFVNNSNGATFSSLALRDNFLEIQTGTSAGTFELKSVYYNTITKSHCAGYAIINVNVLKKPFIETKEKSCIGLSLQCKLMEDSITLYSQSGQSLWTVLKPDMSTQSYTTSSNPFSIPDSVFNMPGKYQIFASSQNALYCDPEFAELTIVEKPPKPQTLEGEDHICVHFPYFYSTNIVDNTLMHWHLTGATDTGFVAHNGSITWNTYGTKNMILYREWEYLPGCVSDTLIKQIHNVNLSGSIVGNDSTFEDMTGTYVMDLNGSVGDVYEWSINPPSAGNISAGQGNNYCTITWLHQASPTWATIYCKVTKCGTKITFTKNVFIDKSAEITSFTANPNPVCSGVPITFVVHTSGAPVSDYYFDFGDGFSSVHTPSNPNNQDTITHIYSNMGNGTLIYAAKVKVRSSNNGLITSTANISITVNPQPNSYLSPANPTSVPPDTLPMTLNISTTNAGTNTFQWYYIEAGTFNLTTLSSTSNTYTISTNPPYDGDYWCVVTNNYGCATRTNHKILNDGANSQGGGCFPLAPAGIDSMPLNIVSTMPCGQAQVGCSVLGDTSNIITWNWGVSPSNTTYTTSGSGTINQSPVFTFEKAGMYQIVVAVQYKNAVAGNPPCTKSKGAYVIAPMVADFIWGFGCLAPNYNTYQLLLYDYSSLYPGYATQTRKWEILDSNMSLLTTIYANSSQDTLFTVPSNLLGKPIFVKLSITNNQQSGVVCTKLHSIAIPNLPIADFSVQTTYTGNPANPYKSCENRKIAFINNSSLMSDIHTYIWNFGNGNKSYMVNTFEVYEYNSLTPIFSPQLTITDKYGCKDDTSVQIQVFDNTLHATTSPPILQYNPSTASVCPNDSFANPVFPLFGGGSGTIKYQWYKDSDTLYNVITPSLNRAYAGSGGYWVQISDANNCYLNLNPTPVLVSVKSAPTAIISGTEDVCGEEKAELWVNTGMSAAAPLTYLWSPNGYTTKKIIPILTTGSNPYAVTVTDNIGGCTAISTPFTVTKHALPSPPGISGPTVINCQNYELGLSVTAPITGYTYTWSTGLDGPSISVYNGGAYRLWVRDTFGCNNHNDIAIPYPADYYFWRFPTGCYSFCPDELPKRIWPSTWVYGNQTQLFASWAWIHDGNLVGDSTNGPQQYSLCNLGSSFGVGNTNSIPCRLFLGEPNSQPFMGGEGVGDYSWELDNHICKSNSDILSLSINECCKLDLRIEEIRCISASPLGNKYHFILTVDGIPSPTQYNLSGINNYIPFSLPNAITINSLSPTTLNTGINQLTGTFTSQPNDSVVQFFINILSEDCYGESTIEILPKCPGSNRMAKGDTLKNKKSSDLATLSVFPNPDDERITIKYSFATDKFSIKPSYALNIYDNMGVIMQNIPLSGRKGEYKLNVGTLSSGIYYVVLMQNKARIKTTKVVINH